MSLYFNNFLFDGSGNSLYPALLTSLQSNLCDLSNNQEFHNTKGFMSGFVLPKFGSTITKPYINIPIQSPYYVDMYSKNQIIGGIKTFQGGLILSNGFNVTGGNITFPTNSLSLNMLYSSNQIPSTAILFDSSIIPMSALSSGTLSSNITIPGSNIISGTISPSALIPPPTGPSGYAGNSVNGPQGPIGYTGPTGSTGNNGAAGLQGSQGSIGNQGSQGNQGPQGPTGSQGSAGNQGPQGPQGSHGAVGSTPASAMTIDTTESNNTPNLTFGGNILTLWATILGARPARYNFITGTNSTFGYNSTYDWTIYEYNTELAIGCRKNGQPGATVFQILWGDTYTYGHIQTSDVSLKTNIGDISYGLNEINQLRPVSYKLNYPKNYAFNGTKSLGLISQEAMLVIPEVVDYHKEEDLYAMNYTLYIPVLVKAIQELYAEVMLQEEIIGQLESQIPQYPEFSLVS